jgi:chitodextrinase
VNCIVLKRHLGILSLLILGAIAGSFSFSPPVAAAACATPGTNYGTATMKLTVATAGTYRLWTHMSVPDATNNSYLLDIDGASCFTVGDVKLPTNTWTWVDYQGGNATSKVTASLTAGTHTLKLIGREPNVKIDRILASSDQNCLPSGFGDNCMTLADTTKPITTITMPDDLSTITGDATVKASATDASGISKVEFYIQDVLKATDTTSPYEYQWAASTLPNGTYNITVKSYDAAGNSSFDARSVTVKHGVVTPPSAPVSITAKATASNEVVLNWLPGTPKAGAQTSGLRFRVVRDNVVVATVTTNTYTDKTVVAGKKYSYHIVAVDQDNNTSTLPASPVTVTTPAATTKDTQAPTMSPDVIANDAGSSQINVKWQASTDNVGVTGYDLYRSKKDGAATKIATVTGLTYGDSGLEPNTAYTYYVIARDAAGNSSLVSHKDTATTLKVPPVDQRTSAIEGTVKGESGRPLAGAKVMLWVGDKRHQATTNWRGKYSISNIPAGNYEVKVKVRSYNTGTYNVKLNAGKTKWLDATLRR